MQDSLRQYLYADVKMINSFFNQIYPDIKSLDISKSKGSHSNLNAEVKLPSILNGFMKGNFSGEYGRDRGHNAAIKVEIPLEEKIKLLCSKAVGKETTSIVLPKQTMQTLILGKAQIISEHKFEEVFTHHCMEYNFGSLSELYQSCLHEKMSSLVWVKICALGKEYCRSGNHISLFKLMRHVDQEIENSIEIFLLMDSMWPIRMFLSYNKFLLSEGSSRGSWYWRSISNTNVLGILYKQSSQIYSLKPLALWTIVDYSTLCKESKYLVEDFINRFT